MGGRGASSGGKDGDDYLAIVANIGAHDQGPLDVIGARRLMIEYATTAPTPMQGIGMPAPEAMVQLEFDHLHVAYPKNLPTAAAGIAAMIRGRAILPDKVNKQTRMVLMATAEATMGPATIAASDNMLRSVVTFEGAGISLETYVHESMHLYLKTIAGGVDALTAGAFRAAMDSGEATPYPQGEGSIDEDFVESCAIYVSAPEEFAAIWPQRAAVVDAFFKSP